VRLAAAWPSREQILSAGRTYRELSPWRNLPAVRDLGELLASTRKELPAAV
jgi:hypothetical protein